MKMDGPGMAHWPSQTVQEYWRCHTDIIDLTDTKGSRLFQAQGPDIHLMFIIYLNQ